MGDEEVGEDQSADDPPNGFQDVDVADGPGLSGIGPAAEGEHGPVNQAQGEEDEEGGVKGGR